MHTFEFIDISFSVTLSKPGTLFTTTNLKEEKVILNKASGLVNSGNICAILGPSGSGKTCLLNILSGRISCGRSLKPNLTGRILFDGKLVKLADIQSQSAFVSQDDALFSYLTVEETLLLSAHFNLPIHSTDEELNDVVNDSIRKFGLEKVRNTIVGSATRRGISGGERKRVAIAKELLSDPLILFMDEPTSGLDSFQALSVVETFRILASSGKIVITVVHQPRSSIFFLFDTLMLLAEGKVTYFGDISNCTNYFSNLGYPCPLQFNPADYVMDIVSVDSRTEELRVESENRIVYLSTQWLDRERLAPNKTNVSGGLLLKYNQSEIYDEISETEEKETSAEPLLPQTYSEHTFNQLSLPLASPSLNVIRHFIDFKILTWRSFVQLFRNHFGVGVRVITLVFFAAILSLIYQRIGYNQKNIQDRIGIIFFVTSNQAFGPVVNALNTFPEEKEIVRSEQSGKRGYSTFSYISGRFIAEVPLQIVITAIYASIIYWSVNLNPLVSHYFTFICIMIIEGLCAMALGFAVSAISPNSVVAMALGPPILVVLLLFSGFYINSDSLPLGSRWVQYISFVKWAFEAFLINEFVGENFTCDTANILTCEPTGDIVLMRFAVNNRDVWYCIMMLVFCLLGYLIVAYLLLIASGKKFLSMKYV